EEADALLRFLGRMNIDMIQWRNLNYDPLAYFRKLNVRIERNAMIGMDTLIRKVRDEYPEVMHGYFNPSKQRIRRARTAKKDPL
ncbi:MAG: hypothetical protein KAS86_04245, partial [Candidatus Omnitrophica bacterium]|nr:hypothetical protein [Candidatus Omnitrophota bacterium]